jgi:hypothetical protein
MRRTSPPAPSSNAHIYRLLIFKELVRYCLQLVDKAFCLSAAKKKEYEAFRLFRQLLFLLPRRFRPALSGQQLVPVIGEANYSKAAPCLASLISRPQHFPLSAAPKWCVRAPIYCIPTLHQCMSNRNNWGRVPPYTPSINYVEEARTTSSSTSSPCRLSASFYFFTLANP